MDQIIDCFVKFFLKQAEEIQPQTIQALIDHGYRTKLSLTAMDLTLDLPLIEEVPLAQRSLLRKYIGALQESQPFSVTLSNEPVHSTSSANESYPTVPIKKRKYDVFITDLNNSSWMGNRPVATTNEYGNLEDDRNSTFRKRPMISPPSSGQTEPKTFIKIGISAMRSDGEANGVDGQQPKQPQQQQQMDYEDETKEIDQQEQVVQKVKPTGGRGKKSATAIVRTKSQILHDKMLQALKDNSTLDIEQPETHELDRSTSNRGRGRKSSAAAAVRTPSQIRYEKLRLNVSIHNDNEDKESTSEKSVTVNPIHTEAEPQEIKVMTPAERAILAKIEAKKKEAPTKNANRRRKRF